MNNENRRLIEGIAEINRTVRNEVFEMEKQDMLESRVLFDCEECGNPVTADEQYCGETNHCEACMDKWHAEQIAYWKPLYEGEKLAGLLPDRDDR